MFQKTVVDPQFTEAIDAFLIDDKARRLSPRTLESYAFQLNRFVNWCAETRRTTHLSDIDAHTLRTYLAEQHDKGLSPWTVHGSARVLRTFGRWCAAEVLVTAKLASIPAPTASPSRLTSVSCASDSAAVNTAFALTLRRSVVMLPSGVVLLGLVSVSSPLPYQQNSPPFNFNQTRYIPLRGWRDCITRFLCYTGILA